MPVLFCVIEARLSLPDCSTVAEFNVPSWLVLAVFPSPD